MPDGTVLVAGSGHANPGYAGQNSAQIYSPPYLFKGPRPTISLGARRRDVRLDDLRSPPRTQPRSARSTSSRSAPTPTRSDMDQHFVPLSFAQVRRPQRADPLVGRRGASR